MTELTVRQSVGPSVRRRLCACEANLWPWAQCPAWGGSAQGHKRPRQRDLRHRRESNLRRRRESNQRCRREANLRHRRESNLRRWRESNLRHRRESISERPETMQNVFRTNQNATKSISENRKSVSGNQNVTKSIFEICEMWQNLFRANGNVTKSIFETRKTLRNVFRTNQNAAHTVGQRVLHNHPATILWRSPYDPGACMGECRFP